MAKRVQHQNAYILHTRPYSESSWLIDAFSKHHGRVNLLAKGARRQKSKVRGLIRPFQPLLLSWSGKGELQTLTGAETSQIITDIERKSWLCACYMNELLVKLLHKHDPHENLFDHYDQALVSLRNGKARQIVLRVFEKQLLQEIGYGLILTHDVHHDAVQANRTYQYHTEKGPILRGANQTESGLHIDGATLIALDREQFENVTQLDQIKRLMRALLNKSMQGKELRCRSVLKSISTII